jgi:hypothetical protein
MRLPARRRRPPAGIIPGFLARPPEHRGRDRECGGSLSARAVAMVARHRRRRQPSASSTVASVATVMKPPVCGRQSTRKAIGRRCALTPPPPPVSRRRRVSHNYEQGRRAAAMANSRPHVRPIVAFNESSSVAAETIQRPPHLAGRYSAKMSTRAAPTCFGGSERPSARTRAVTREYRLFTSYADRRRAVSRSNKTGNETTEASIYPVHLPLLYRNELG